MHDENLLGWIVLIAIAVGAVILGRRQLESGPSESGDGEIVVRTYRASNQQAAARQLGRDAELLAARGYQPVSQSWAQGQWGCGAFLVALLLFVVVVGIVVFVYMLLVKPEGTLTVTFQRRAPPPRPAWLLPWFHWSIMSHRFGPWPRCVTPASSRQPSSRPRRRTFSPGCDRSCPDLRSADGKQAA